MRSVRTGKEDFKADLLLHVAGGKAVSVDGGRGVVLEKLAQARTDSVLNPGRCEAKNGRK